MKAHLQHFYNLQKGELTLIIVMMTSYIWSSPRTISFYPLYSQLITGKSSWLFILKSWNNSVTINILVRRIQKIHFHSIENFELLVENNWKLIYFSPKLIILPFQTTAVTPPAPWEALVASATAGCHLTFWWRKWCTPNSEVLPLEERDTQT